ncbi:L-threonine 3-dehydrogenase [Wickerhamomyces ciferrii]|uniref:L-threonine 3-dehydrogenase n=1 Tax=Wickerhamomyces ciferrii (strain ATCC 14091 / BCRC 22168 / CBS 111 / JCM 3599 / NBRC 0793 / NRRL Y-1031 F-60-10) TaxID=1206466 RepID=K0KKZ9_WICCF|nr:L-threonine 3-dehydrogenase [Wickerhamomyces ciferrii]CCH42832.1 L-threonine 3-dehydrogenase [Wickerhamomyces ciferrii]
MTVQDIKASVLLGPKQIDTISREISDPIGSDIQVEVQATTLCGSDVHYYTHGANGDFKVREPLSLGHEAAGIVKIIGPNVNENLKIGDRVAFEVGTPCGNCKYCRIGRYNLCPKMLFRSSAKTFPHLQGTLQDRINISSHWCHKIPDNLQIEHAALAEPLSVAIHAANRAKIEAGSRVLILGAGAVGLFSAAVAKVYGATEVVIADIAQNRLDFALENGIANHSYLVNGKRGTTIEEKLEISKKIANDLIEKGDGGEYDYTFECTGVESCVQTGIFATAPGGKVMFVGMGNPIQHLHIGSAALREVDLLGVFRYANCYPTAIELMSKGKIPALDKMITHTIKGIENSSKAFEIAGKPFDENGNLVVKVVIVN